MLTGWGASVLEEDVEHFTLKGSQYYLLAGVLHLLPVPVTGQKV